MYFVLMGKFKHKYRIESSRLKHWNYNSEGLYFVTINTEKQKNYFGEIINGEMVLNELGLVVYNEWMKTKEIRPDMNLELGEFVVMPNHFHGILGIGKNEYNDKIIDIYRNTFGPQKKNLGSIVRGFKSAITTYAKKNKIEFGWQERFHDHIIRSYEEYLNITNYIKNNPKNWKQK